MSGKAGAEGCCAMIAQTHADSMNAACGNKRIVGILRAMLYRLRSNCPESGAKGRSTDLRILLHWILSAIALLFVSRLVPGFYVASLLPALIAAAVIGLLNATLGLFLKIITFPISILTLGIFLLVINGVMILVAASLVPGFHVYGFAPAFWGAVVLALLGMLIRAIVKDE
jgi:putative membrane protein